ncbi:DUF2946 domain-containing protein [Dyella terrae]|uniref:DUF2946 domain-containing protein n=1 Tax=Dyella terrae TaxID=522259 RepID=UPI0031B800F8|nr:DUF2946 protein [Dyella terrae]
MRRRPSGSMLRVARRIEGRGNSLVMVAGDATPHPSTRTLMLSIVRSCLEPTQGLGKGLIRRRTSRRFVAWLALAAMWLLVAAPTVSRVLPALVSVDAGAWCANHGDDHADMAGMPMPGMPDMPSDPSLHMDQCGYCAMLAHTPLLSGGVVALLLAAPLPAVTPDMRAMAPWHAQPLLSANPRGPPFVLLG